MRRSARGPALTAALRADVSPLPGTCDAPQLQPLPHRHLGFRIVDVARHAVDELFERVRAFDAKNSAAIAIGIDVDGGLLLQLVGVSLGPLGGAEQPGFFAIPRADR